MNQQDDANNTSQWVLSNVIPTKQEMHLIEHYRQLKPEVPEQDDPSNTTTRSNYIATIPPEPERTNTENIRSSNVFTTLVKIKRNVKRVRKRINNHKSKKVAHLFGNRFDRRSNLILSQNSSKELIAAIQLLSPANTPQEETFFTKHDEFHGFIDAGAAEALMYTLQDYDYDIKVAHTILSSIKKIPVSLRKSIGSSLSEDEMFQLLICFANFDVNKNGSLDFNEFRCLFSSLISCSGVSDFFQDMDLDNDGNIAFGEFLALIASFVSSTEGASNAINTENNNSSTNGSNTKTNSIDTPTNTNATTAKNKNKIIEGLADIGLRNMQSIQRKDLKRTLNMPRCLFSIVSDLVWPFVWIIWFVSRCFSATARSYILSLLIRQPPRMSFIGSIVSISIMWLFVVLSLFATGRLEWANRDTLYLYIYHSIILGVLSGYGCLATLNSPDLNKRDKQETIKQVNDSASEEQRHRKSFNGIFRASSFHHFSKKKGSLWRKDGRVGKIAQKKEQADQKRKQKAEVRAALNGKGRMSVLQQIVQEQEQDDINNSNNSNNKVKPTATATQSSRFFQHAEFFAPSSIHQHEERFRTNLVFFPVETAGRCDTAREVFAEVIDATHQQNVKRSPWIPFVGSIFCAVLRCVLCEVWSVLIGGPQDTFYTLTHHHRHNLTTTATNEMFYRTISASRSTHGTSPSFAVYLGWFCRSVGSIVIYSHTIYVILCVREEFIHQIHRVQLLGSMTSPEQSLEDNVPFLNLQVFQNVVAFTNIRTYMISVYHREVERIVNAVQTMIAVVALVLFLIIAYEYTFFIIPNASTPGEFLDSRDLLNWFDFVVYGLMIVLFIQAGCDLKIAKEEHVKILAFERWRVEVKARGGSSNGEISPSRFDRVRDVLTEVIHFLKLISEENSILGIESNEGLRNSVIGFYATVLGLVLQGMYSLRVLGEQSLEL